jgi:hypothetical protein
MNANKDEGRREKKGKAYIYSMRHSHHHYVAVMPAR